MEDEDMGGGALTRAVWRCLTIIVLVVLFAAGCTDDKDTERVNGPEASSSAGPDSSESTTGTKSDGSAYAKERARTAVLAKTSELPEHWRPVPVEGRLSGPPGRPEYCGVVAEPDPVRQSAVTLYEEDPSQSRILQYTFVSTEAGASATMGDLVAAADGCSEEGFTVRQVAGFAQVGDGSIALDYTNESGAMSRTIAFRTGDTLVVLVGYGQLELPHEALQTVADRIDRLLAG